MRSVRPITRKVNLIIVLSLAVGIGLVISFLSYKLNADLTATTRGNLDAVAGILHQAIKNVMLPGDAPIAVSLLEDARRQNEAGDVRLFRVDGVEAFSDNRTIARVNGNLGRQVFQDKPSLPASPARVEPGRSGLRGRGRRRGAGASPRPARDRSTLTVYNPLLNLPRCSGCHGTDHTVRGVTRIRYDLTPLMNEQRRNLALSGAIFVGVVLLLTAILGTYVRAAVIDPVKRIGDVCNTVTRGQLDVRVEVRSRDEIGVLADTINEMIQGLHERFELSKFVSSSTLRSIRNGEKGAKVRLTMLFSDVRGFTSYTERNPPEQVVESLNRILNMQTDIIHRSGGDVDKYVGDEVVALFSGVDHAFRACHAALEIQREIARAGGNAFSGLSVGIGIDSGEVILGMIGSDKRADYTVIGDHVNFAARLCSAARPGQVIVSEAAWSEAGRRVPAKGPYRVQVRGKAEAQRVYVLEEQGVRA